MCEREAVFMLKISPLGKARHVVTLKLEGRIVGPWVGELSQTCESNLSEGRALKLDLADVSFADAEGVAALTRLQSRGVNVINCSPFVVEQLKAGETLDGNFGRKMEAGKSG
jgi:ABC-type transporter Mla MlaB component